MIYAEFPMTYADGEFSGQKRGLICGMESGKEAVTPPHGL
jgi:hypothetical protein